MKILNPEIDLVISDYGYNKFYRSKYGADLPDAYDELVSDLIAKYGNFFTEVAHSALTDEPMRWHPGTISMSGLLYMDGRLRAEYSRRRGQADRAEHAIVMFDGQVYIGEFDIGMHDDELGPAYNEKYIRFMPVK